MLIDQCKLQAGHNVLIWGAAGGLGVFATQLCKAAGANAVGVVSSAEKGELVKQLGAVDYIDRNEFAGMMRNGGETPDEEKARFKESRGFAKRVKAILGDAPDFVFEHVGQATFPTSVFTVKPFGKVVICGATSGYTLDFDVRYLWMRQKQIIGSHFANAYECMRANQLMAEGKIQPVLWQVMGFDGVAEAHQLLHENKHLGKISILVGATTRRRARPRRARARSGPRSAPDGRRLLQWRSSRSSTSTGTSTRSGPTAGTRSGSPPRRGRWHSARRAGCLTRSEDDPLLFRQTSVWDSHEDFERYWYSDEIATIREQAVNYYNKPVLPVWHALIAGE